MTTDYKELIVGQKSIELIDVVYDGTERFPKKELFGLSSQMQRAAISVASNIAEGSARHSRCDFIRFLRQARGSLADRRLRSLSQSIASSLLVSAVSGCLFLLP